MSSEPTMYYFPLESYAARYTRQLSAYKTGWYERNWYANNVNFIRVDYNDPKLYPERPAQINTGVVLDANTRALHCLHQCEHFIRNMAHQVETCDVLFFDDFWHPGVEAIKYALAMRGVRPVFAAYCWAQSVDQYDFMRRLRPWVLDVERAYGKGVYDKVFVANTLLKELLVADGVTPEGTVHVVGLPFDSSEVRSRYAGPLDAKQNRVVFSSRFDEEKRPAFFLQLVDLVKSGRIDGVGANEMEFVICTSHPQLRSNQPGAVQRAREMAANGKLRIAENLSVEDYYKELAQAKVQFNCAYQDWVSFTLLEAVTFGCVPVYPYFRAFPETLGHSYPFLYHSENFTKAAVSIKNAMCDDVLHTPAGIASRRWIVERYDDTWLRILNALDIEVPKYDSIKVKHQIGRLYQTGGYAGYSRVTTPVS